MYLLSPTRWPLNQTLEKFGVIAILKFLLEIAQNPGIAAQCSLFSLPVYAFTISKSLNILNE